MNSKLRITGSAVATVALVMMLSLVSARIWGGKPEGGGDLPVLTFRAEMTVDEFGAANELPRPVLREVFGLTSPEEVKRPIDSFGMTNDEIVGRITRTMTISSETESRDWRKILVKFILWLGWLGLMFGLMRRGLITASNRKWFLIGAAVLFGVVMGSDPNPMGTVKDAVELYGSRGVIFPPRMVALAVFLAIVLVANKFICIWGCQFGTLQDFLFRLNRDPGDNHGIMGQVKLPFLLTNTVRVLFFFVFTGIAIMWGVDIVAPIDPFLVFKPAMLSGIGIAFLAVILMSSLFVYRPFCHLFCPFGLAGWFVEKISIFHIKVDYDTCIACGRCENACPSTVMAAILRRDRVLPDCFTCGTCINTCPVGAISFNAGRRSQPPNGKFDALPRTGAIKKAN